MTLLGKVFTGMVFLLSVIFFALSVAVNSTHTNHKTKATNLQKQLDDANRKIGVSNGQLEEQKTELAIERSARRSAIAALQTQLEQGQSELQTKDAELADLRSAHTLLAQTERATLDELKARTDENESLRKQAVATRQDRDQMAQRLGTATDKANRLQGEMQSLEGRTDRLASDFTKAKQILDSLDIDTDTILDAPPAVNGLVTAVLNNRVEVSLGRDDGMREGFTLEVHRLGQYLGRLKVRTVADDKSVAEILTGYQKGRILRGDRVDSKLF